MSANLSQPGPARPFKHGSLRHYLTIYAALWRNSVVRELSFKTNFILWIIVELMWFALQVGFITVIYGHTERIATWTKWEVVLLMGVSFLVQQLFSAIFLNNLTHLSEYIRTGKLDFMLLLPANTRFLISFRQVDLGGFVSAASAAAVIVYAAAQLQLRPGAGQILAFLFFVVCGVLIHFSIMTALTCASFFTVRAQGIVWGYYNLFNIARLPDAAFRGFFKVFFTYAIPMLLVANVPAKALLDKLDSPWEMLLLTAFTAGCLLVSEAVWRYSIRSYTSASS